MRLTSRFAAAHVAGAEGAPPAQLPHADAGLAAAHAIGGDLDLAAGARSRSGEVGELSVRRTLSGSSRRYFKLLSHLYGWWGAHITQGEVEAGIPVIMPGRDDCPEHAITGTHGDIRIAWTDLRSPCSITMTWDWQLPPEPFQDVPIDQRQAFLQTPSSLRVELGQQNTVEGDVSTTVSLTHEGLPIEWLKDMEAWWQWRLEAAEAVYALNYR